MMKYAIVPLLAFATLVLGSDLDPEPVQLASKKKGKTTTCDASTASIVLLNASARAPVLFCMWWRGNNGSGKLSPLSVLSNSQLDSACKCLLSKPTLGRTTLAPETAPSIVENLVDLRNGFAQPLQLCQYWLRSAKDASPFIDIAPSELTPLCQKITSNPKLITTTKPKASTTKNGSGKGGVKTTSKPSKTKSSTKTAKQTSKASKKGGSSKPSATPAMPTWVAPSNGTVFSRSKNSKDQRTSTKSSGKKPGKVTSDATTKTTTRAATTTAIGDSNGDDDDESSGKDEHEDEDEDESTSAPAASSTADGGSYGGSYGGGY